MDKYEAVHGKDVSSFDFTSTHRLPTVSAAQALEDLETDPRQFIPTGLETLDRTLANVLAQGSEGPQNYGGVQKGQIIEVWGPPGSGKTTMQLVTKALRDGSKAVWVDTSQYLCQHRLGQMTRSLRPSSSSETPASSAEGSDLMANLIHYFTPTLAHLIALLCKPEATSIPSGTSLVVIDGISSLMNHAFPRNVEPRQSGKGPGPGARRIQILQSLVSALQKLSATRGLVMLVLSQCATRMHPERGAVITPAINAPVWEQGVATRLVLFRDWLTVDNDLRDVRLIGVQKCNGQVSPDGMGTVIPFTIDTGGLSAVDLEAAQSSLVSAPNSRHHKRKLREAGFEVADSEGEDYGWEDEDEAEMPNMPPQWQGSEDLLLGRIDEDDDHQTGEISEVEESYQNDASTP
ncbi:P-loop containing nucleoside triphosphate hydrolase protein [Poronia punctata]|nr:P-loop containing nucleoside triphosphate hydrolase protein [Poronia punctata]